VQTCDYYKLTKASPSRLSNPNTHLQKRAPAPPEVLHSESTSTASLIDVDTESVHTVPNDFKSHTVTTETQEKRIEREAEQFEAKAKEELERAEKEFAKKEKEAKAKAKKVGGQIERNSDNPVFIGNAVAVVALSAGLGFGAYRKYAAGELTWKVVAAWTGVVGLFAAGDYYLSSYLFKNKYPPKK
jgi:cation transport ATPase